VDSVAKADGDGEAAGVGLEEARRLRPVGATDTLEIVTDITITGKAISSDQEADRVAKIEATSSSHCQGSREKPCVFNSTRRTPSPTPRNPKNGRCVTKRRSSSRPSHISLPRSEFEGREKMASTTEGLDPNRTVRLITKVELSENLAPQLIVYQASA